MKRCLALLLCVMLAFLAAGCSDSGQEGPSREESAAFGESESFRPERQEADETAEPEATPEPTPEPGPFLEVYGLSEYTGRADRDRVRMHFLGQGADGGWFVIAGDDLQSEKYSYEITVRSEKYYGEHAAFEDAAFDISVDLTQTLLDSDETLRAAAGFFSYLEAPEPAGDPDEEEQEPPAGPLPEEAYFRSFRRRYAGCKALSCTLRFDMGAFRSEYGHVVGEEVREGMGVSLLFTLLDRTSGTAFFPEVSNGADGRMLAASVEADGRTYPVSVALTTSYRFYDTETGDYPDWEGMTPEERLAAYDHIAAEATMTMTALVPADYDGGVFCVGPGSHEAEETLAAFAGRTVSFAETPGFDARENVFFSVEAAREHSAEPEEPPSDAELLIVMDRYE